MNTLVESLSNYVPALITRRLARDPRPLAAPLEERIAVTVLFADISGFTALTEALTQRDPTGAEELTRLLNAYFTQLIEIITNHGGDIVKFLGDGLIAIWGAEAEGPALTTLRAVQCGLGVKMMMTPDAWHVQEVALSALPQMRIGIATGEVTLMHLGGVFGRWELLITGDPITDVGRAQRQAQPGDVVLAPTAWALVRNQCQTTPLADGFRLDQLDELIPLRGLDIPQLTPEMVSALRAYVPKAILARTVAHQGDWIAELRRVTVLFINLPDLAGSLTLQRAQTVMQAVQEGLYHYEGSILRLGTDDKGPTLMAAFGLPPLSHEDDAIRATLAACAIAHTLQSLGMRCSIGITTGQVLCVTVGSDERCEYTMMGTTVNLAARLMQAAAQRAAAGSVGFPILCEAATFTIIRNRIAVEVVAPIMVKGRTTPVPVYTPTNRRPSATPQPPNRLAQRGPNSNLIGREAEQLRLSDQLGHLVHDAVGGVTVIAGEAGIGKTRLVDELVQQALALGVVILTVVGSATDHTLPFYAWQQTLSEHFGLDQISDPTLREEQIARLLATETVTLRRFAPLLNRVLDLDLPADATIRQLRGQAWAHSTCDLLLQLLQARHRHTDQPQHSPLLLVVKDAQWLDSSSWNLVLAASQQLPPMLTVITIRPDEEVLPRLYALSGAQHVQLTGLSLQATQQLIGCYLGTHEVPLSLAQLIHERTQGNPLFIEELLVAMQDKGLITITDGVCRLALGDGSVDTFQLSSSMVALITSRVDRLLPAQQLTLKVASVIGQTFHLSTLQAIHPVASDRSYQASYLATLELAGLITRESDGPDPSYRFRHSTIRNVTYDMMIFAQRRQLHRLLAAWLEQT